MSLVDCPGSSGEGCPRGSAINLSRQLCHTCRKDKCRTPPSTLGGNPRRSLQAETVEGSGFSQKFLLKLPGEALR